MSTWNPVSGPYRPGKDFLQELQCPLVSHGIEGNNLRLSWRPDEGTHLQHLQERLAHRDRS